MCGPSDCDLEAHLPPGTQRLDCTYAPSGHVMLPFAEFGHRAAEHGGAFRVQAPLALSVTEASSSSSSSSAMQQ
eukprot:10933532-Alexandrium_andersonii.AAC.1